MENKKIDVLFGLVVIAFLAVTIILVKDFRTQRSNDYKEYTATLTNIVRLKNFKIRYLSNQLAVKERENEDLKNTLGQTRNDLDALSRKLAQQTMPAVPTVAAVPTPTVAAK